MPEQTELIEKPAVKTASIEEIAAPLVNSMPDVTQAAEGQNLGGEEIKAPPVQSSFVDGSGKNFDPEKHATNPDGTPKKNANGNFYAKSVGRPKNKAVAPSAPVQAPTFADVGGSTVAPANFAPIAATPDRFAVAADSYLQLSYALAVLAFSPDVKPDEAEHEALKIPAAQLLRRYDVDDIHPGITFAAVATGIFLKKLEKPTVRERWDALMSKAKTWITKTFKR